MEHVLILHYVSVALLTVTEIPCRFDVRLTSWLPRPSLY